MGAVERFSEFVSDDLVEELLKKQREAIDNEYKSLSLRGKIKRWRERISMILFGLFFSLGHWRCPEPGYEYPSDVELIKSNLILEFIDMLYYARFINPHDKVVRLDDKLLPMQRDKFLEDWTINGLWVKESIRRLVRFGIHANFILGFYRKSY